MNSLLLTDGYKTTTLTEIKNKLNAGTKETSSN